VLRADNPITSMCRLSWNLVASTSWNPQGLSSPVQGSLHLYRYLNICTNAIPLLRKSVYKIVTSHVRQFLLITADLLLLCASCLPFDISLFLSLSLFLPDFDTVQWKVRHKCLAICCRRLKAACCKQGNERLVPLTALVALRTKYRNITALRVPTVRC